MWMLTVVSILAAGDVILSAQQRERALSDPAESVAPVVFVRDETGPIRVVAVDPGARNPAASDAIDPAAPISPDGRYQILVDRAGNASDGDLFLAPRVRRADGEEASGPARRVTELHALIGDVHWLPDSRRVVFETGAGPQRNIWCVDAVAAHADPARWWPPVRRLSAGKDPTFAPRVARDGHITYLIDRELQAPISLRDLVLISGSEHRVLVERKPIAGHAISDDGERIAYCEPGRVVILNLVGGARFELALADVDPAFSQSTATRMTFDPRGGMLVAALDAAADGAPLTVLVIPVLGSAADVRAYRTNGPLAGLGWLSAADAPRAEPSPLAPLLEQVRAITAPRWPDAVYQLDGRSMHVECNTQLFMVHEATMSGDWQDAAPQLGPRRDGIVLDVELCDGAWNGQAVLPQQFDRRYFIVHMSAPYDAAHDRHLLVHLSVPPGADPALVKQLRDVMDAAVAK